MSNRRLVHLSVRWGLLASLVAAVFWGTWSIFAPVPMSLPPHFMGALSRWWDVPAVGICVALIAACLAASTRSQNQSEVIEYVFPALLLFFTLFPLLAMGCSSRPALIGFAAALLIRVFAALFIRAFVRRTLHRSLINWLNAKDINGAHASA